MLHIGQRSFSNLSASDTCQQILNEVIHFKDSDISNWIIEVIYLISFTN